MKHVSIWLLLFIFMAGNFNLNSKSKSKIVPLPQLLKPTSIVIQGNECFIPDGVEIHIYSLPDVKLTRKFGKAGEGPQEFNASSPLHIFFQDDTIVVKSKRKLSFFKKDGTFIKEMPVHPLNVWYVPMGNKFIGLNKSVSNGVIYFSIDLCDLYQKTKKNITRIKHYFQDINGVREFVTPIHFYIYDDKIFLIGRSDDLVIDVFDGNGEALYTITHDYPRIKVTEDHIKNAKKWYKRNAPYGRRFESYTKLLRFPKYFPAIWNIRVSDKKIYVLTHSKKPGQFYILDLKGNIIKKVMMPFVPVNPLVHALKFTVHDGKLYQLVDNEETETWELHITPFNSAPGT